MTASLLYIRKSAAESFGSSDSAAVWVDVVEGTDSDVGGSDGVGSVAAEAIFELGVMMLWL